MYRRFLFAFALLSGVIFALQPAAPSALAATCTWTGLSADWADGGNWTNCSGAVPGGTDTAVIPSTANNPVISADADIGTLTINSGAAVTINDGVTLTAGSLNLSGTLTGGGDITVSLTAVWHDGGVMSGGGETHIMGSATFDLSGYSVGLDGRTLRNEGAMTWTGPSTVYASVGATFINAAAGTINAQATAGSVEFHDASNTTSFQNQGAITVNGANSGYGLMARTAFSNNGAVAVQDSWLRMAYGSVNSGDFLGGGGAFLFVGQSSAPGQSFTFGNGSNITIEYVVFDNVGTVNVSSYYDASGANGYTSIMSNSGEAALNFTPEATIVSLGNRLALSGNATVNLSSGDPVSIPRIDQTGTLTGTNPITVTSLYNWSGVLGGSGTLTVADGATMYTGGIAKYLDGRALINHGTIVWRFNAPIHGNNGAVIDNYGSFDARDDATFTGQAAVTFNNHNLLVKSGGSLTAFDILFNNYGTVAAQSGEIAFTYGDLVLPPNSSYNLAGGNLAVGGLLDLQGGVLTGSGVIQGDVRNGGLIAPGESPGSITIQGHYTQTLSGTLAIELAAELQDSLVVTGTASLAGRLEVTLLEFSPAPPDSFQILSYADHTGEFDALLLPNLSGGYEWEALYGEEEFTVRVAAGETHLYLPLVVRP